MEKIPTAEEFFRKNIDYVLSENDCKEDVENAMIEFAKLHVEAALKAAGENAHTKDVPYTEDTEVDKGSILNSYPLENIK
jgi:hypothetical protein